MQAGDPTASCSFARQIGPRKERSLIQADIFVRSGMGAWRTRLRAQAEGYAREIGNVTMWAMPLLVAGAEGDWLVYRMGQSVGRPEFLKRMPTRESAEMWMMHGGD